MMPAKRVTFTIPADLLEAMDREAEAINLTRSAYIAVAVSQKIQQDEMMRQLPYLVHKLQAEDGGKRN